MAHLYYNTMGRNRSFRKMHLLMYIVLILAGFLPWSSSFRRNNDGVKPPIGSWKGVKEGNDDSYDGPRIRIDPITGVPRAIYDPGFVMAPQYDELGRSLTTEPRDVADAFLQGMSKITLVPFEEVTYSSTKRTPAGGTVRYRQHFQGIEVYEGRVSVTVADAVGAATVSFFMSTYQPLSFEDLPTTTPEVSRGSAYDAAVREMDLANGVGDVVSDESQLVVYFDERKAPHLAWRIRISSSSGGVTQSKEFLYDGMTGENLQINDLIVYKQSIRQDGQDRGFGRVHGGARRLDKGFFRADRERNLFSLGFNDDFSLKKDLATIMSSGTFYTLGSIIRRTLVLPFDFVVPLFLSLLFQTSSVEGQATVFCPNPLATAKAKYTDPGFGDNNDQNSPELEAQLKAVVLQDITLSWSWLLPSFLGFYSLEGPNAKWVESGGLFDWIFFWQRYSFSPDFSATRDNLVFEGANAYYHLDHFMRYVQDDLGIADARPFAYDGGVRFDPHSGATDDSYYDNYLQLLSFGDGGVDDAEDADVVIHLLGRGLHDWITDGGSSNLEGLTVGFSDYLALSYSRSFNNWDSSNEEYYWVFAWDGHNEFWNGRVANYDGVYPQGLTFNPDFDGQIWSTCAMKLWDLLGREKSDTIQLVGISYTDLFATQLDAAFAILAAAKDLGYPQEDIDSIEATLINCGYGMTCGNGIRDDYEECEGNDIGNSTCADGNSCSVGLPSCNSYCTLDFSKCTPGLDEAVLQFTLEFDQYSEETSWDLVDTSSGSNDVIASGSSYDSSLPIKETICFRTPGCYRFTIYDMFGDGMMYGGDYSLVFNGMEIPETNPDFGMSASHDFGLCEGAKCGNGIMDENANEECDGNDFGTKSITCQSETNCTAGSPRCTPWCKLDLSECSRGPDQSAVELKLTFDKFAEEISWTLQNSKANNAVVSEQTYTNAYSYRTIAETQCVDGDGCYNFTINDEYGDGLCCFWEIGGYSLTFNDAVIDTTPDFGHSSSHIFGMC